MRRKLKKFEKNAVVSEDGDIFVNVGQYAKAQTLLVYEMLGGVEAYAKWAEDSKDDYYNKHWGKLISVQLEHTGSGGGPIEYAAKTDAELDNEIARLTKELSDEEVVEDAEYEVIEDYEEEHD